MVIIRDRRSRDMSDDNVVFVGSKPVMNYVLAVTTQFNRADEVIIKSRGQAISRAVDAAEIVRNRFMTNVSVKDITISTEVLAREDGSSMNVSAMEITLRK